MCETPCSVFQDGMIESIPFPTTTSSISFSKPLTANGRLAKTLLPASKWMPAENCFGTLRRQPPEPTAGFKTSQTLSSVHAWADPSAGNKTADNQAPCGTPAFFNHRYSTASSALLLVENQLPRQKVTRRMSLLSLLLLQFQVLLTLFSKFFSTFDHSTCSLSVSLLVFSFRRNIPPDSRCTLKQRYSSAPKIGRLNNHFAELYEIFTLSDVVFQRTWTQETLQKTANSEANKTTIRALHRQNEILNLSSTLFIRHY